ncbi:MAG: hypothetical protein LBM99_05935 [Bacillales bacterium]|jgi:hypothetical protein|nr:hypothetical protein [Bacillales bacterium]
MKKSFDVVVLSFILLLSLYTKHTSLKQINENQSASSKEIQLTVADNIVSHSDDFTIFVENSAQLTLEFEFDFSNDNITSSF